MGFSAVHSLGRIDNFLRKKNLPGQAKPRSFQSRKCSESIFLLFIRIIVIAGDVTPIDVISHFPVMCEDRDLPYCYVPSKVVS